MDILNRLQIIKYHQDAIIKFGINSKEALGWKNEKNQLQNTTSHRPHHGTRYR